MVNYGKSKKNAPSSSTPTAGDNQVDALIEFCKDKIPSQTLLKSCSLFIEEKAQLHNTHQKIIQRIASIPFLAAFIVWTKEFASLRSDTADSARLLLEQGFIHIADKKKTPWTLADARAFDHRTVLDHIRSQKELPFLTREALVVTYITFMKWLSEETHAYISRLEDPDHLRIKGRAFAHLRFTAFLDALNEKEQLVAKLLYFGGSRQLEEVLNLQLEQVDFARKLIQYQTQLVSYPGHVFADIKSLIGENRRGRIFLGRQNAPLNPATIFRNFKEAALKIGLEASFSPASLVLNV